MSLPFALPDWLPWWAAIAILVPVVIYVMAFLTLPFSTIGVKGRLDLIEARLDEIQGEIRSLVLRLPESGGVALPPPGYREAGRAVPPIAPAPRARRPAEPAPPAYDEARYDEEAYDEPREAENDAPPPRVVRPPEQRPDYRPSEPAREAPRPDSRPDLPRRRPEARPSSERPSSERPNSERPEPRIDWPR
jgi:hypothetical protein